MDRRHDEPSARWAPAGHFYSPLPAAADVARDAARIWGTNPASIPGVDLRVPEQLAWLEELQAIDRTLPWPESPRPPDRYYFANPLFGYGDGLFFQLMLRRLRPRRLVEAGSGFTSALALDTNDRFLGGAMACTFIDPLPERLRTLLRPEDERTTTVIPVRVQDVSLDVFTALGAGDVLLIDSTHVSKIGSDVNFLFFEVLPRLAPGVVVHVHDVFPGFEYPRAWVEEGRAWNENYLLRAFLQFNHAFEIVLQPNLLATIARDRLYASFDLEGRNIGGSLWMRRRPDAR